MYSSIKGGLFTLVLVSCKILKLRNVLESSWDSILFSVKLQTEFGKPLPERCTSTIKRINDFLLFDTTHIYKGVLNILYTDGDNKGLC